MSRETTRNSPRRLSGAMAAAAWLLGLALLTWLFNDHLETRRNPNQQVASRIEGNLREVVLTRNRQGHYRATGMINGQPVEFLLDTGATDVVIPGPLADRLGLQRGAAARYQTANGPITAYRTRLQEVRLGAIRLRNVAASINPGNRQHEILLGMSALRQLEFAQQGDNMVIRQYAP